MVALPIVEKLVITPVELFTETIDGALLDHAPPEPLTVNVEDVDGHSAAVPLMEPGVAVLTITAVVAIVVQVPRLALSVYVPADKTPAVNEAGLRSVEVNELGPDHK